MRNILVMIFVCGFGISTAHGATLTTNIFGQSPAFGNETENFRFSRETSIDTNVTSTVIEDHDHRRSERTISTGDVLEAEVFASASADSLRGQLKARSDSYPSSDNVVPATATAEAWVKMSETFEVSGTGTVDAFLSVHGIYHPGFVSPFDSAGEVSAYVNILGYGEDSYYQLFPDEVVRVQENLHASASIVAAVSEVTIEWYLRVLPVLTAAPILTTQPMRSCQ